MTILFRKRLKAYQEIGNLDDKVSQSIISTLLSPLSNLLSLLSCVPQGRNKLKPKALNLKPHLVLILQPDDLGGLAG
ncbi:MAG: hypothetical protein RLZZ197_90 [Bacteroidota bacterium]